MATRHAGENPLAAAAEPTIYNVTLTNANTEYPQAMPTNIRKIAIRPRNNTHSIKVAFTAGMSGTNYLTVDSGFYFNDMIGVSALTVYMQSATAGAVVEIEAWA